MSDMWSDLKGLSYISMTIHFINCDWSCNKLLFSCFFPDERHTGKNSRHELRRRFVKSGFASDQFDHVTFVTDRRANIIKAIENYKRLDCVAHVVNTVLKYTFDSTFD